ncbi:nitrate ABC transporter permease [Herbaspirillum seropedicae]|uniref:ABC-type nitrate transporter, permease component protein n=1 Tax=Herbaspirillum seropedicae (strain SmR1) TaxID=757424 RepID=D8J1V4_HERSS|nr:nitrate ABC transporter permease [Herbaspirillum seropedicae]ADJ62725.1 ABC-type nitrate transporter, permease component protein [Herbaspirillum seropedicae SmR1]AKN64829.1 nitrate ABC transporter permease [Herbaspirillum seropedicae]NQE31387.1 nitrate ABC transporter permease [Herbaspirillum seropedicae]UMU20770.1 nitrate ABC transporter permease [Herbaspirillum seropedicae]
MSAVVESIMGENAKPAGPAGSHPPAAVNSQAPASPPAAIPARRAKKRLASGGLFMRVAPPLLGLALLVLVWQIIALKTSSFPTPWVTLKEAGVMFADPFYRNSPNDQGIGWNVLASLQRVGTGFGLAALVGIPLGFAIGRVEFLARMFGPIISLLRPVSPLAWLPIGLLVFKSANPAAIWSIFICSIWPMIINTAVGVQRVPQDYMNVARVLNLSEWKVLTKILFPSVLPYMLTGVRLSIGTAWLVIVAAEMLTGGVGIGFWVWDEWNNLNVPHIIIAIVVIGVVGLVLEQLLVALAKAFTYEQVNN